LPTINFLRPVFHARTSFATLAWVALCWFAIGQAPAALAAERRDLTQYLPADTLVVVHVRDMPGLLRKWDASPFHRFYGDPRCGAFFGPLRAKLEAFKETMNSAQGIDPDRLWKFFSGDVLLAGLAAPAGSSDPIQWVLIYEHNGDPTIVERLKTAHHRPGARIQQTVQSYGGLEYVQTSAMREIVTSIPVKKSKKGKKHKKFKLEELNGELTIERSDDAAEGPLAPAFPVKQQITENNYDYFGPAVMILAGAHEQALQQILARMGGQGGSAALTDSGDYARLRPSQKSNGNDLGAYVNVAALAGWWASQGGSLLFNPGGLRLEEVRAAAFTLDLRPDRLAFDLALLAPPPRQGLSRLLFLPTGTPPEAARLVPPQAVIYAAMQIPLPDLWPVLMETLRGVNPAFSALIEGTLMDFEKRSGVNVSRDLVGRLGTSVVRFLLPEDERLATEARPEGRAHPTREGATYAIAVNEAASFRPSLLGLLDSGSQTYQSYGVEADKAGPWPLWALREGQPGVGVVAAGAPNLYLCVTDHWLLLGTRRAGIDAVIERLAHSKQPSLADRKPFTALRRQLPADRTGELFLGAGGVGKLFESALLKELAESKKGKPAPWLPVRLDAIPEPGLWSEYFGPLGSAMTQHDGVLRLRSFVLYPAPRE